MMFLSGFGHFSYLVSVLSTLSEYSATSLSYDPSQLWYTRSLDSCVRIESAWHRAMSLNDANSKGCLLPNWSGGACKFQQLDQGRGSRDATLGNLSPVESIELAASCSFS